MTGELRRLVALTVTLAPSRAVAWLGRLDDPGAPEGVRLAAALAAAPRRARLAALASSLPAVGPSPIRGAHRLLQRLERERRGPEAVGRTQVRAAGAPAADGRGMPGASGRHGP